MKHTQHVTITILFACLTLCVRIHGQGTAFTYQGRLNDGAIPATGIYDLRFSLYDALINGSAVSGEITNVATSVSNGLFTATLDFGAGVFTGAERWLEISVRTNGAGSFATLTPRQPVTSTPYAITAGNVTGTLAPGALSGIYSNAVAFSNAANQFTGTFTGNGGGLSNVNAQTLGGLTSAAFWKLQGNNVAPGQFLGSTNDQPLELRANGARALRLEPNTNGAPNVIAGSEANQVDAGVVGAVISGGGATNFFGGIAPNRVLANYSVVGGGVFNTVRGESSGIGGGTANTIQTNALYSVIAGGLVNTIQTSAWFSVIDGGYFNVINEGVFYASIGGGQFNTNAAGLSVIGGGQFNTIQPFGDMSVIGGGWLNRIESGADQSVIAGGNAGVIQSGARESFIGGGFANTIGTNASGSFIGGGFGNTVPFGFATFIGGGTGNTNSGPGAFIGAGYQNRAENSDAVVGGGVFNVNASYRGVIGGGEANVISNSANHATIAGGSYNINTGGGAFIGGGIFNRAENFDAVIAGGGGNVNAGYRSFIGSGEGNVISNAGSFITIGGGRQNVVSAGASTIAGGSANIIGPGATTATISGGLENTNFAARGVIGGGRQNVIELRAIDSIVAGGILNTIQSNAFRSTISGGQQNTIGTNAESSTIGGGWLNNIETSALRGTIGGGAFQTIQMGSSISTISGGNLNIIESNTTMATIAGGQLNAIKTGARGGTLSGGMSNIVAGRFAVVPGGLFNSATGAFSFAGGVNASARHNGAFVWADSLGTNFSSTASNQFLIRASGGVGIGTTNPTTALEVVGSVKAGGFMDNGSGFMGNGGGLTNVNAATLGGLRASNFWQLNGNNVAAGQFLGSTNNQAVNVRVNNQRALRLEPTASGQPNIIGGADVNAVSPGVSGATIGGGSANTIGAGSDLATIGGGLMNLIMDGAPFGTISGGNSSRIENGALAAAIGGGQGNTISENAIASLIAGGTGNNIARDAVGSVISGGTGNEIDRDTDSATIGGGEFNRLGDQARWSGVGGGYGNFVMAGARYGAIGGGRENQIGANADTATMAGGSNNFVGGAGGTVSGGRLNLSQGFAATVPGGQNNEAIGDFSFAAGRRAKANHSGSFVWADSTDADFGSAAADQFIVRATNGVGINTRSPGAMLQVGDPNTPDSQGMIRFASHAGIGAATRHWDIGVPEDDFDISGKFFSFVIDDPQLGTDPEVVVRWDTGNVGIGTLAPSSRLHSVAIAGNGVQGASSDGGASGVYGENSSGSGYGVAGRASGSGRAVFGENSNGAGLAGYFIGNVRVDGNLCAFNVACPSDRNVKTGFEALDAKAILEKVAALSITRWRYTNDTATPHIGPVAQDFHAAFGVGPDNKQISTVDADGVALAAIQGLNAKLTEELKRRDVEIAELKRDVGELKELLLSLRK